MKSILVIDQGNDYYIDFFNKRFSSNRNQLRITSNLEEAKELLNLQAFTIIFIGDIIDIAWIDRTVYSDANINIISYSMDPEIFKKQRAALYYCKRVPFPELSNYLDLNF